VKVGSNDVFQKFEFSDDLELRERNVTEKYYY